MSGHEAEESASLLEHIGQHTFNATVSKIYAFQLF